MVCEHPVCVVRARIESDAPDPLNKQAHIRHVILCVFECLRTVALVHTSTTYRTANVWRMRTVRSISVLGWTKDATK